MPLGYRLIRTLATCAVASASFILAAAAQPSRSWTLCASRDVRLADQAIEACSALISGANDSDAEATAHGYRGIALRRRARNEQDREQGMRDLEKAAGAGLGTAVAYVFRGQLHVARQNPDLAIAEYDEAIRRDPQTVLAFAGRGSVFLQKQDYDRAIADYSEAIRLDPAYAGAFVSRARAYMARADWSRALADLDRALQLDSMSRLAVDAFTSRATVRNRMSDPAGATADNNAALKLNPHIEPANPRNELANHPNEPANPRNEPARNSEASALVARAGGHIARADWTRAITDLDQALRLDSTSPAAVAAFTARATARYQMSDFAGAIADGDAALKLDPHNERALRIRSFAHAGQGTASSNSGASSMPDALLVYVARGPAGSCGEKCDEWVAAEGTLDWQGPQRLIAALDRLGARKLPVVLNFRGRSTFHAAMSIGKLLRERGFDATVGQTLADECRYQLAAECMALKRTGKPVRASLVPSGVCNIVCVLGLAGGVRRTLPISTTVVIGGIFVPNRIGLQAAEPFREGRHVKTRDLIKVHLTQMGVDPQIADMVDENSGVARAVELSREDVVRMRIVTPQ
jgi:tetratricopeptide (TPR) repeat protein